MTQPRFQSTRHEAHTARASADGADPDCAVAESMGPSGSAARAPALHVVTFGCQMNKYDSLFVEGRFRSRGYATTAEIEKADVVLFNTCSVREHAEERVYSWLGELKRVKERRPELVIGVMGCMAQRVEEEIFERAGQVDIVCGTRQLHHLPELVDDVRAWRSAGAQRRVLATGMEEDLEFDLSGEPYGGERHAYLAIMRGCNLNCTFCVVPKTRGRVASRTIEAICSEARWMVERGAKAITLLGQTVNSYGEDLPSGPAGRGLGRGGRPSLADLLYALQGLEGLARIRLVTLHPSYVTPALARALADCDKCDRFLPLPVQSGSDRLLRRMKRGYTVDLYRARVDLLRQALPDIELGTDWIVGFPGEDEGDFRASEELLREQGFIVNYVFKYSPRPDTSAARRPDDVPEEIKKERNQRLLSLSERVARERMRSRLGTLQEVLIEETHAQRPGVLRGRTRHNLPVTIEGGSELIGTSAICRITQASPYGLGGHAEQATALA